MRAHLKCQCGRIFFDGEDPWPHVREHFEHETRMAEAQSEIAKAMGERAPRWFR